MKKIFIVFVLMIFASTSFAALPKTYDNFVVARAGEYGIDPLLIHADIQAESGHINRGYNGVCCYGLMQLHGQYFKGNLQDPDNNINQGTRYIKQLMGQFGNNTVNALRAYNWGPGNMRAYLKGTKRTMPAETINYTKTIANYYYQYGGKGNHFSGNNTGGAGATTVDTSNPNNQQTDSQLDPSHTCPKIDLPGQDDAEILEANMPALPVPKQEGSAERTVYDPAKYEAYMLKIQQIIKDIEVLKGQYQAITKGAAGLGLLTNITSIAGYQLPTALPSGQDEAQLFGAGGQGLYKSIVEQRASDTGVYASSQIGKVHNQTAQVANHAYAEAEMAWTQASCSIQNLKSLNIQTNTWKQSKDVSNRIALERASLVLAMAKIRASTIAMQSSIQSYSTGVRQYLILYNK